MRFGIWTGKLGVRVRVGQAQVKVRVLPLAGDTGRLGEWAHAKRRAGAALGEWFGEWSALCGEWELLRSWDISTSLPRLLREASKELGHKLWGRQQILLSRALPRGALENFGFAKQSNISILSKRGGQVSRKGAFSRHMIASTAGEH